jgi:hypothetical protein
MIAAASVAVYLMNTSSQCVLESAPLPVYWESFHDECQEGVA